MSDQLFDQTLKAITAGDPEVIRTYLEKIRTSLLSFVSRREQLEKQKGIQSIQAKEKLFEDNIQNMLDVTANFTTQGTPGRKTLSKFWKKLQKVVADYLYENVTDVGSLLPWREKDFDVFVKTFAIELVLCYDGFEGIEFLPRKISPKGSKKKFQECDLLVKKGQNILIIELKYVSLEYVPGKPPRSLEDYEAVDNNLLSEGTTSYRINVVLFKDKAQTIKLSTLYKKSTTKKYLSHVCTFNGNSKYPQLDRGQGQRYVEGILDDYEKKKLPCGNVTFICMLGVGRAIFTQGFTGGVLTSISKRPKQV